MPEPEEKESAQELKKLPNVAGLEDITIRKRVMQLLEDLDQTVREKLALSIREDDLKEELEQLQKQSGKVGFRHGWLCFRAQQVAGRKTLDKMLLLENGCPASVLNSSYKTGKPTTRLTFKHLDEEI
jgi:hypothetical protein